MLLEDRESMFSGFQQINKSIDEIGHLLNLAENLVYFLLPVM